MLAIESMRWHHTPAWANVARMVMKLELDFVCGRVFIETWVLAL